MILGIEMNSGLSDQNVKVNYEFLDIVFREREVESVLKSKDSPCLEKLIILFTCLSLPKMEMIPIRHQAIISMGIQVQNYLIQVQNSILTNSKK